MPLVKLAPYISPFKPQELHLGNSLTFLIM